MKIYLLLTALLAVSVLADPEAKEEKLLADKCLNCICVASSGCNKNPYYDGNVCGPLRISWGYWLDAGSPTVNNSNIISEQEFINCGNKFECAARTVEGYMERYRRDCDGNGKIDCDDYARIHHKGPRTCTLPLEQKYKQAYENCMKK